MKKFFKFLIGLVFLPFVFFLIYDSAEMVPIIIKNLDMTFPFLLGVLIYFIVHKYICRFSRLYVLAHEISHALAAWCCGYKVTGMKIKEESGNTTVSGINTFVLLAPYCLPLYALVCMLVFYITSLFWPEIFVYNKWFLGIFGFLMSFHILHTYKTLTETEQSDVSCAGGGVFSFVLIAVVNLTLIIIFINFLFPGLIKPSSVFKESFIQTLGFWKIFFVYMHKLIIWLGNL